MGRAEEDSLAVKRAGRKGGRQATLNPFAWGMGGFGDRWGLETDGNCH